jgi:hypothetical protein
MHDYGLVLTRGHMELPTFLILRTKLLPLLAALCLLHAIDADAKLDTQGESALA